jgi:hypothetical protein
MPNLQKAMRINSSVYFFDFLGIIQYIMYSKPGRAKAVIIGSEERSGRITNNIINPSVDMNPPIASHFQAMERPIIVDIGKQRKANTSLVDIILPFSDPIRYMSKKYNTKTTIAVPEIRAIHLITLAILFPCDICILLKVD